MAPYTRRLELIAVLLCITSIGNTDNKLERVAIKPDWQRVIRVSKTNASLQVVVSPLLQRGSPVHDRALEALRNLRCDYVRYVPWLPYPKLAVAELEPPRDGKTFWDFSLIDPITIDVLNATVEHPTMVNFSVIPQWMFRTDTRVAYPDDPAQVTWRYQQGNVLRDPSLKEVGDYYARLVSWYTKGGFTDEYGKWHGSGHRFKIDWWEVLNEPDWEHTMTPEQYTAMYDVIVTAVRKVSPQAKFVGLALAAPEKNPKFFEHFLNPKNHKPGIPLNMISYHFYAQPAADQIDEAHPYTFFSQADGFLDVVRYVEAIRQRLSPETQTAVNEIGSIRSDEYFQGQSGYTAPPIPAHYWNLSGATYAYIYNELALLGIEVASQSALAQLPRFYPSVSMLDWNTGQPNARYWVLKLLRDNFGPGDRLVSTSQGAVDDSWSEIPSEVTTYYYPAFVYAQGLITRDGLQKVLLVNKRNRTFQVSIPGAKGGKMEIVDQKTGFNPPMSRQIDGEQLQLDGFAVAVVTLPSPVRAKN